MNHRNRINKNENHIFTANPSLKLDHVYLKVSDLQNSIDFYQSILGFRVLENRSGENMVYLVPGKTSIGHVHLHVSKLSKAKNFYQVGIGLYLTA
jgi:catechol-2,3-dioxygenase